MEIGINFPMLIPVVEWRTTLEWAARAEAGPFGALGGRPLRRRAAVAKQIVLALLQRH